MQRILRECPVASGHCDRAAVRIEVIARERDPAAKRWRITPIEGRFVLAKHPDARGWYFHDTVEVDAHCVDALTGVDGVARTAYEGHCWEDPSALAWQELR